MLQAGFPMGSGEVSQVIELKRFSLPVRGHFSVSPPPLSWDYLDPWAGGPSDLAAITCSNGHTTRMVAGVHRVDPDGTVYPSYVCTATGCAFHAFVRLVGWPNGR